MDEKMYKMFMFRLYVNRYLDKEVERNIEIYDHLGSVIKGLSKFTDFIVDSEDELLVSKIMDHLDQIKLYTRRNMIAMQPKNFWEMIDNNLKES